MLGRVLQGFPEKLRCTLSHFCGPCHLPSPGQATQHAAHAVHMRVPHRAYACVPSGNTQKVSGAVELLEEDAESEVHAKG